MVNLAVTWLRSAPCLTKPSWILGRRSRLTEVSHRRAPARDSPWFQVGQVKSEPPCRPSGQGDAPRGQAFSYPEATLPRAPSILGARRSSERVAPPKNSPGTECARFNQAVLETKREHSGTAADHPPEGRLFECRAGRAALGDDAHFVVRQAGKDAQRDRQRQLRVVDQRYPDIEVPAPLRRFEDELGRLESERRRLRDAHDLVE